MTLETTSTSEEASVQSGDIGDQIAELLVGEEETEEVEAEDASDELEEGEEPEESDDEDEGEATWSSVLGIDDDKVVLDDNGEFAGLIVKVDGETSQVPIKDLVSGYQTAKSTTQKSQALSAEKKQFDAHRAEAVQVFQSKLSEANQFVGLMQNKLMTDYEGVDWQNLRNTNPAEYAASIQDFNARKADIEQIGQKVQNEMAMFQQKQSQEYEAQKVQFAREHAAKLIQSHPEWSDASVAEKAFSEMRTFVSEYGYSDEEFAEMVDSRALNIIQDAMKYRSGKKIVEKKISKPVPKYQKSSGRKAKAKASKLDTLVKQSRTAKGGRKRELQSEAIAQLLMG